MNRQIPWMASWVLQRFGVAQQNQALVGDLAEEYQGGRSAAWLCWQIFVAIRAAVDRDLRSRKLLVARAIAIGWLLILGEARVMNPVIHWIQFSARGGVHSLLEPLVPVLALFSLVPIGWLIAQTDRQRPSTMVMAFVLSMMPFAIGDQIRQHYHPTSPIPSQSAVNLFLTLMSMLCLMAGGLLQAPAPKD